MNWTTILAEESRKNSILRLDDVARRYHVHQSIARNALRRYEARGLVEHISNKVYVNRLNQNFSPRRACQHSALRVLYFSRIRARRAGRDKPESRHSDVRDHRLSQDL